MECPCKECITLAMCKSKFIDNSIISNISSKCSIVKDFLLGDDTFKGVTYKMFKENRERSVKEILTGRPYGYRNEEEFLLGLRK